jgi:large subunit ribosomal protein L22
VAGPHASLKFLRLAPRKVRLVADTVRGLPVAAALAMLKYRPQAAAKPLAKLLLSAVANAENKGGKVDVDALVIKTLTVDQGPKMRRFMPRAMGRAFRVEKKTSHVYVELGTVGR